MDIYVLRSLCLESHFINHLKSSKARITKSRHKAHSLSKHVTNLLKRTILLDLVSNNGAGASEEVVKIHAVAAEGKVDRLGAITWESGLAFNKRSGSVVEDGIARDRVGDKVGSVGVVVVGGDDDPAGVSLVASLGLGDGCQAGNLSAIEVVGGQSAVLEGGETGLDDVQGALVVENSTKGAETAGGHGGDGCRAGLALLIDGKDINCAADLVGYDQGSTIRCKSDDTRDTDRGAEWDSLVGERGELSGLAVDLEAKDASRGNGTSEGVGISILTQSNAKRLVTSVDGLDLGERRAINSKNSDQIVGWVDSIKIFVLGIQLKTALGIKVNTLTPPTSKVRLGLSQRTIVVARESDDSVSGRLVGHGKDSACALGRTALDANVDASTGFDAGDGSEGERGEVEDTHFDGYNVLEMLKECVEMIVVVIDMLVELLMVLSRALFTTLYTIQQLPFKSKELLRIN